MIFTKWKSLGVALATVMVSASTYAADLTVEQLNKTFVYDGEQIEELTIKVGDTIYFQNDDPFFHNIFSLSDLKTFDLGSYPAGQSKSVTFDSPGEVEIECAIHPEMYLLLTVE